MKRMFVFLAVFLTLLIGFVGCATAQQNQAEASNYGWLNGTWEGPAPSGGTLRMHLRVVNGNEIEGTATVIEVRGSSAAVWGSVSGDKVKLEFLWGNGDTVKYRLSLKDDALVGRLGKKQLYFSKPVLSVAE